MAQDTTLHQPPPTDSPAPPGGGASAEVTATSAEARPLVVKVLLAMGLATGVLLLLRAGLGLANVATDPRVSWSTGVEVWQVVPMVLFATLLPALLTAGVAGVWRRMPGARRLTILSAGLLIVLGVLESGYGLLTFFRTPQPPMHAAESLVHLVNSFLANNGVLLLLVIVLRPADDGRITPTKQQPARRAW